MVYSILMKIISKQTNNKRLFVILFMITSVLTVNAQHMEELYSPYFFGLGPQTSSLEAPTATLFNPAAAGLEQRVRLGLNYMLLAEGAANPGWGHAINLGISLPTTAGVFSFYTHYTTSSLQSAPLGNLGGIHAAFSKELYPNFLFGIGISSLFGTQYNATTLNDEGTFSIGADLGITHVVGDLAFMKDFTWGFAIRNIGYANGPIADSQLAPRIFTPAIGANVNLIKTEPFRWNLALDVSAPMFSNFLFYAATEFEFFNLVTARASYHLDLYDTLNGANNRFPVSFGISVNFKIDFSAKEGFFADKGWQKNDLTVNTGFAPLSGQAFAAGIGANAALGVVDNKPPKVKFAPAETETQKVYDNGKVYISPNLDGTQDNLELTLSIDDERFVKGFRVIIMDKEGNEVRVIENKETREEDVEIGNILDRFVYVEKGIIVPETVTWDGKNTTGTVVEDGTFSYVVEAWDDNGNIITTEPKLVEIDSKEPEVEIKADYTIFSPNDDGNKDELPIQLEGSEEDTWTGKVLNESGEVVSTFEWTGKPKDFSWNGKSESGELLTDGVYSVAVSSTDRAGNTGTQTFDNIIINTQETPIFLTVNKTVFSPNGDAVEDAVELNVILGNTDGISSWTLEYIHESGNVERVVKGGKSIKEVLTWDGKKDTGTVAPEGLYNAKLTVEYVKGDKPVQESKSFRIDNSAPVIELNLSPQPFSPDNDGSEDELNIAPVITDISEIETWDIEITDPKGNHFTNFTGTGTPSQSIIWNGISDTGELVQAASDYSLTMTITDIVGNTNTIEKTINVDVLVIRDGNKLYIIVPSITFKPNTSNYKNVNAEAYEKNMWTLNRLAVIFKKYKSYQIEIEGHAVSIYWYDEEKAAKEQTDELIPLAKKRAEAIKQALVELGIEEERISTVGIGALRPIVPFSDKENRWKNRRVEFVLIKN